MTRFKDWLASTEPSLIEHAESLGLSELEIPDGMADDAFSSIVSLMVAGVELLMLYAVVDASKRKVLPAEEPEESEEPKKGHKNNEA